MDLIERLIDEADGYGAGPVVVHDIEGLRALLREAADALEAAQRDTQRLEALANGARVIKAWSRPDMLEIRLPDTLTADTDGLMLDVLRNAIDNATGVPNG